MARTIFTIILVFLMPTVAFTECKVIEYPDHNEVICAEDQKPAINSVIKQESPQKHIFIKDEQIDQSIRNIGRFISKCKYGISYKDFNNLYPDFKYEIDNIGRLSNSNINIKALHTKLQLIDLNLVTGHIFWDMKYSGNKVNDLIVISSTMEDLLTKKLGDRIVIESSSYSGNRYASANNIVSSFFDLSFENYQKLMDQFVITK